MKFKVPNSQLVNDYVKHFESDVIYLSSFGFRIGLGAVGDGLLDIAADLLSVFVPDAKAMATAMSQSETYGIELDTLSCAESNSSVRLSLKTNDDLAERNAAQLPRVDGGFGAWTFLISSWFLETFVWGLGFSAGTIQACQSFHKVAF